jgi:Kinetochore complex Fta4 of Sim4 subunit, or CENP-50
MHRPLQRDLILVNLALRKHYRLQYSVQAIRHVASQIEELYRTRLDADIEPGIQGGENAMLVDILSGKADYTDPKYLPSSFCLM